MKRLLTPRDTLLSILAGYTVYTYPDWKSTASAIYCGIVVAVLCGCVLVALNNSERKMCPGSCRFQTGAQKIKSISIIGD